MREIPMWKETPTAPYSLKTFLSCWVLLGFPPSGSLSSRLFSDDVVEASFKVWTSCTKTWDAQHETGGWTLIPSVSVAIGSNNKDGGCKAKKRRRLPWIKMKLFHFPFKYNCRSLWYEYYDIKHNKAKEHNHWQHMELWNWLVLWIYTQYLQITELLY